MHTKEPTPVDPNARYEATDIRLDVAFKFMVGIFALTTFGYIASWWFLKWIGGPSANFYMGTQSEFPVRVQDYSSRRLPKEPHPLLQDSGTMLADTRNYRRKEKESMNAEGVDPATGKRRVSVSTAMDMEAQKAHL